MYIFAVSDWNKLAMEALWGIIIKRLMSFALKRLLALASVAFTADMNGSVPLYPILLHITNAIGRQLNCELISYL